MGAMSFVWGSPPTDSGSTNGERARVIDTKAVAAELVAMFLFVIIGCGAACGHGAADAAQRLVVAFAFGMAIMVLAYKIGHHSGGHINCAVTFSLVLGGELPWYQGLANFVAQLLGSTLGACYLALMFNCENDMTKSLGTNAYAEKPDSAASQAFLGEVVGTFILCYTVWETAVNRNSGAGSNACLAIGFSVFLAHILLLPIDGCSINPTRSIGPFIIASIRNCEAADMGHAAKCQWVTWVGPLLGAALAAGAKVLFLPRPVETPPAEKNRPNLEV